MTVLKETQVANKHMGKKKGSLSLYTKACKPNPQWDITSSLWDQQRPKWGSSKRQWECTMTGVCSFYGKYYRDFLQTRYRHAIGFSNPTTRFLLKRLELVQKRYTLYYAYNCIFHNSQNIDSIKVLSHEWIETMWCIHTVEYYSNLKNKTKQNSAICMKQVELEVFAVE